MAVDARAASDWLQWRGPRGDGVSSETGWRTVFPEGGPTILWQQNVGIGYSSVSVGGSRLYTAGWSDGRETVFCLDVADGDVLWRHTYPSEQFAQDHKGGPGSTPALHIDSGPGRVYFLSRDSRLFCLNAVSGKEIWVKTLTDELGVPLPAFGFSGSPVLDNQILYVDAGRIVAIEPKSGNVHWKTKDYGPAYSTPVPFTVGDRRLLAAYPRYGLVVLDAATGNEVASHAWEIPQGINAATPAIEGTRLFVSSGYGKGGVLVELANGSMRVVWETKQMQNQMTSCVVQDGHLYGFDRAVLKCLDLSDGQVKWSQRGLGRGTLMAANGRLIIMSEAGELVIADVTPEGFRAHERAKVIDGGDCWTVPVLAAGRIYCRSSSGQIVCVDVRGE